MTAAALRGGATRAGAPALERVAALGLAALVVATWLPSLGASFQFDDWNVIVRDPRVQSPGAWLDSMPGIRPLLKLSFALSNAVGGGPAAFRAFNVLVHALNAALLLQLLGAFGRRLGLPGAQALFAALLGATVFALHPVQTEAVTYVSGRSSALSALFALLALAAWLRGLDTAHEGRARLASLLLFAAALGVKEPVAVLPAMMAAWLVASGAAASIPRRLAPFAALLVLGALAILAWGPYRAVLDGSLGARSIGTNLLTQVDAIVWLIGQLLRPDLLNADPALAKVTAVGAGWLLRAAALLALAVAGLVLLWRRAPLGLAIAWFFLWLLPTNSLLPRLDVANDRQLYLAIAGPAWALGLLLAGAWRWRGPGRGGTDGGGVTAVAHTAALTHPPAPPRSPRAGAMLALALLAAALAGATLARNRVYATEITFWQDVARKSPSNPRAANNLGYAYALACRDAEALAEFARAMRLTEGDSRAALNHVLLSRGMLFPENQRSCEAARDTRGR